MTGLKAYKGEIHDWKWVRFLDGDCIKGRPVGHPDFVGWIITSKVVSLDRKTGMLETQNSRYKLIGKEHG